MSTHVSPGGIAARTISLSLGDRGGEENDQEEDFPATSKQMTDHRPGSSLSTAPDGNERFCEQQLRCQSVHHPLHQVSFHHTQSDVRREGRKNSRAQETLSHCRSSLFIFPSFPKTPAGGSPRESLSSLRLSELSATQRGHGSHQLDSAAENIRSHPTRLLPHGTAPTAQTEMTGKITRPQGSVR